MSSLLSTVSGKFSQSLILGTFFPVTIFVILGLLLLPPLLPEPLGAFVLAESIESQWHLLIITLSIIVLSGLLYNLNIPLIRLYEGYPWNSSWLGTRRVRYYKKRFRALQARSEGIRVLHQTNAAKNNPAVAKKIRDYRVEQKRRLENDYPKEIDWVLPTRLGNTIRNFETYPNRQYGMRSITLWPRLIAKIDPSYAASIDSAKASFDFMLNSSALSVLLALLLLLAGLGFPIRLAENVSLPFWIAQIVVFALLGYLFYDWSIGTANAWGNMVKGAFDLYRWELLKQMGYAQTPTNKTDERQLWEAIYFEMAFGDSTQGPRIAYKDKSTPAATFAQGDPGTQPLTVSRGLSASLAAGVYTVHLAISNPSAQPVTNIVLTDTVPAGFAYEWESATSNGQPVTVEGLNPYRFTIGTLAPDGQTTVTYQIVQYLDKA